ncbi:unnamed protein product [Colias eurytheme]|nr:unnamed protein product [Colias eurytheme]
MRQHRGGIDHSGAGSSAACASVLLWDRALRQKFRPGIERAGPPPPRTVHEGMFLDPSNTRGSRTPNYEPSQTLMRGRLTHAQ